MNKVILIGNMTRDVEIRQSTSGTQIGNFSIAVRRNSKNQDGEYESDFINCTAFNKTCEILEKYTSKGSKIGVIGNIQVSKYETQDGDTRYSTAVLVNEIELLGTKKEESEGKKEKFDVEITDDDLPF